MRTTLSEDGFMDLQEKHIRHETECLELLITGDLCPRQRIEPLVRQGKSAEILSEVKPVLESCDITVTNLETPLTDDETPIAKSGPNLKVAPECVALLKGHFDVALLANNHIGDYGPKPVLETINILNANQIKSVGAGKNLRDARKPLVITKKGIKTAILNFAENEFGGAKENKAGASTLDPIANLLQISETVKKTDIVIVVIHGGNEHNPIPSPRMKQTYRAFIDAGAHAVISMHTHCPQGIEIWNNAPIIYSLGNFLFDTSDTSYELWWVGYMVKLCFTKQSTISVQVIPVNFSPDLGKVKLFDKKNKKQFFNYLQKISNILVDDRIAQKYWDAWCASMGHHAVKNLIPADENSERISSLRTRNIFTCESHCELMTTYLRLLEENRMKQAKDFFLNIQELQNPKFDLLNK